MYSFLGVYIYGISYLPYSFYTQNLHFRISKIKINVLTIINYIFKIKNRLAKTAQSQKFLLLKYTFPSVSLKRKASMW